MGQQLVEEGDRDAPPDDGQEQDVHVGLPVFPVCPVEDEFAWLRGRKERQDDPGDVGWLNGMPVKEAFHTADDRVSVRASWEARGELGMPDVFAPKECEHHEGKQLDLVLAELREVRGEAAGQLGQDIGRRVLFSRVSRTFSSHSGNCRVLREELDTAWTSFQRDFAALSGDVRSLTLNLERKLSLEDLTDFLEFKDAVRSYVERLSNELAGPGRRLRDTLVAVPPERQAALLGQLASVRSGRLTRDAAVLNADQAARVVQREWAALLGWLTRPAGQGDGLEYGIQALRGAVSRVLAFVDAVHRTRELGTGRAAELSALAARLGALDDVLLAREELSQALSLSAPLHAPESFEREGVRHSWLEPVEPVTLRPVTRGRETERVSAAVRDTSPEARQAARSALHAHREHEAALLALFGETNSFELTALEVGDDALVAELLNWLSAAFHASHEASPVVTVPGPAGHQVRIHLLNTPAVLATPSGTLWLEQGAKLELVHTGKGEQT